jgi:branched-chain amino acid transport system permease protein
MDLGAHFVAGLNFTTLPQQLVNGILLGAIYALIALGYTMVYGVLRLINFAHGEVFMLGAYTALLVSWFMGFRGIAAGAGVDAQLVLMIGVIMLSIGILGGIASLVLRKRKAAAAEGAPKQFTLPRWLIAIIGIAGILGFIVTGVAYFQPQAVNLLVMLLASMTICGLIGMVIELLAYRPMRGQPRIAALITAIGMSLLLQYGGALFLPVAPPPSISERVNPYRGSIEMQLVKADPRAQVELEQARQQFDEVDRRVREIEEREDPESAIVLEARKEREAADREISNAMRRLDTSGVDLRIPRGQLIMFVTTIVLMGFLTYLVLYTSVGRAMRAVSHDFLSASLMGVNVNRIVTLTFLIGSMLAGAGAMMNATFMGTPLTTFYGLLPGVKAFVAAVLGGIGNIPGAVVGGLLMGVAETMVVWAGYSEYRDAVAFVILIVVLLFRPGGILGSAKVEKV